MKLGLLIVLSFIAKVSLASEKDLYKFLWLDQDKKVFVLQNKLFAKKNNFYFDLGYTSSLTGSFQDTSGFKAYLGYYFTEQIGVELVYGQYTNSDNAAYSNVVDTLQAGVPFIRRPLSSTLLMVNWSPFYGKINTFNEIFYFDVVLGVGTGTYSAEDNLATAEDPANDKFETQSYTPLVARIEFKLHINQRFHIGAELLNTSIQANTVKNPNSKSLVQANEYTLKLGVNF